MSLFSDEVIGNVTSDTEIPDFEVFWQRYPSKVGKLAARKAYQKAYQSVGAATILAGLAHYERTKPVYADWCHPATFLNQGRYLDAPAWTPEDRGVPPEACGICGGAGLRRVDCPGAPPTCDRLTPHEDHQWAPCDCAAGESFRVDYWYTRRSNGASGR